MSHPARLAPGSRRFLWAAPPWRTLVETWLLGLGIIFIFSRLVGQVATVSFASGLPALCGVCGVWAVLRARVPVLRPRGQIAWESLVSAALGVTMLSLRLPASGLGVDEVWRANWADAGVALLLLGTGVGYAFCRVAVRMWLRWGEMRRQRLVWSLTHAHLMLLFLVGLVGLVAVAVVIRVPRLVPLSEGIPPDPVAALLTQVIVWAVPSLTWLAAYSVVAVVFGLPPLALASYIVARSTIRRLERLVTAASAMRTGEYSARVAVTGEDEVAQLQVAFNTMAETLEENVSELERKREQVAGLLESRRTLIANVSHELRTPVTTVRALLETSVEKQVLAAAKDGEDAVIFSRHDVDVMHGEVLRLQALIEDLFTVARADSGGLAVTCRPVDVCIVVRRMVEALAPGAWREGRVEVLADLPAALAPACADEERLAQVLANLLRNAVRHTPPGGIVAVTAIAEPDAVVLEVNDTGEGIPPDELPYIWERFYQGSNAQHNGGSGLGLPLVKELVEAMGGRVEASSVTGQGSSFRVHLQKAGS